MKASPASRTPWFYGWNVIAVAVFCVATVIGSYSYSFTFFVVAWMEEFSSSRTETMLALTAAQICAGFLLPLAGRAMDRYSVRWLACLGLLFLASGFVAISFASSVLAIIVGYAVFFSVAEAFAGPLMAQTLAAKWFRANRGLAIGLAALGTSLGGFVMPPVIAHLIGDFGWRMAQWFVAGHILLIVVPLMLLVVRSSPADKGVAPEPEAARARSSGVDESRRWTTREVLKSRNFWFIAIGFLPGLELATATLSNLAPYTDDLGIDRQSAAYLMSALSLTMIFGKICIGYFADRLELRVVYFFGIALLSLALVLMSMEPSFQMMLVIVLAMGLSAGSQLTLAGAMISRCFGAASFGTVMGLFFLFIRPLAFGGPLAGWVRDTFGSYDYFWLAGLVITLLFCPVIYWVRGPENGPGRNEPFSLRSGSGAPEGQR